MTKEARAYLDDNLESLDHMVKVEAAKIRRTSDPFYEDLCQEGWVGVMHGLENVRLDMYPFTYLQKCAWSHMMRAAVSEAALRSREAVVEDPDEYVSADLYTMSDSVLMEAVRTTLNARQKDILRLRMDGYTLQEIGDAYGYTREWARAQLERIANKLKKEDVL